MKIKVFQIPALRDNYIYVLKSSSGGVAVVDPSEAQPVNQFLKSKGWQLDCILNTHHHFDHTGGNAELKEKWNCPVVGFKGDAHRIAGMDVLLNDNEVWKWQGHLCRALFIPGHTLGHIAFWFEDERLLFCGDTLFAMGCGRIFEGTAGQMLSSLKKLSGLPSDTAVYCGHEYTEQNGLFALALEGGNADLQKRVEEVKRKRERNQSTLPAMLSDELKINPFLRCLEFLKGKSITHPELKTWMSRQKNLSELALFTQIRKLKDHF